MLHVHHPESQFPDLGHLRDLRVYSSILLKALYCYTIGRAAHPRRGQGGDAMIDNPALT
jgi:hypothetical protein